MSQSLAVKYRPKSFDDVVEQGPIKLILREQLKTKTTKNAYLFTGGAGTGKTTCARIFANEINGHLGNPIEIDAASNNGVDNIRDIIDNAKFKSLDSPFKVYIIDEVHMLSIGAFNAMLKLLEEPPAQTIFILCTTDPQKIPATILSRVQRYDFQRITFNNVVERLRYIIVCESEEIDPEMNHAVDVISHEPEALEYIAKLADGGMRDAITLLDKCISYSLDLSLPNIVKALGTVNYETMIELTNAINTNDPKNAITIIETIHRAGVDLKQFIKQYMYFVLDVNKYKLLKSFEYIQIPSTFVRQLEALDKIPDDTMLDLLDSIIKLNTDIKWEISPKPFIESVVLMLCRQS